MGTARLSMARYAVMAVLALAVHAAAQEPDSDKCGSASNCLACVQAEGCGWCANSAMCTSGTEHGPGDNGPKNCSAWDYGFCAGAMCKTYSKHGCDACVADPFCGWCGESQKCVEGNEDGILWGTCKKGWAYVGSERKLMSKACPAKARNAPVNATDDDEVTSPRLGKGMLKTALSSLLRKKENASEAAEHEPAQPEAPHPEVPATEAAAAKSAAKVAKLQTKLNKLTKEGAADNVTVPLSEKLELEKAKQRDVAERARANATKAAPSSVEGEEETTPKDAESDALQAKMAAKRKAMEDKQDADEKAAAQDSKAPSDRR